MTALLAGLALCALALALAGPLTRWGWDEEHDRSDKVV